MAYVHQRVGLDYETDGGWGWGRAQSFGLSKAPEF